MPSKGGYKGWVPYPTTSMIISLSSEQGNKDSGEDNRPTARGIAHPQLNCLEWTNLQQNVPLFVSLFTS